jgi:hypothetical protein
MSCSKQRHKLHLQIGTCAKTFRPLFSKQQYQIYFCNKKWAIDIQRTAN